METGNMLSRRAVVHPSVAWRGILHILVLMQLAGYASSPIAAEDVWLQLQTSEFSVISQLNERKTRRWAGDFDQFVSALSHLYAIERKSLPPLTIVLFESARKFAPYRPRTESGQAKKIDGVFGRQANWSVMAAAASSPSPETRRVLYHEAVHWFFSASSVELPLWFNEGYAEVLSTFEIRRGSARWGRALPNHVLHLRALGLRPLSEFLVLNQDQAIHGDSRYYPQAWAFVHFAAFGATGAHQKSLSDLARRVGVEPVDKAFESAFGMSLEEGDKALREYIKRGTYSMAKVDVPDRIDSFVVMPASSKQVLIALGRLALVTRNTELALQHATGLIEGHPGLPEGFELQAMLKFAANDPQAGRQAVDRALERHSRDADMYLTSVRYELNERMQDVYSLDQALDADVARSIADRVIRALALQSTDPRAYEMLSIGLMNVRALTDDDERLLDDLQRTRPRSGLPALVRSVSAYRRGDYFQARSLHALASSEGRELPAGLRSAARSMGERWLYDWLAEAFTGASDTTEFDAAYARLEEAMATPGKSANLKAALNRMRRQVTAWRASLPQGAPYRQEQTPTLRDYWQSILDDPASTEDERQNARRALEKITP